MNNIDNPGSWVVLFILTVIILWWFIDKSLKECDRNQMENDDYFWKRERNQRRK